MLTNFNPFWQNTARKAEKADTHQHMVRHEPDQQGRRNSARDHDDEDTNIQADASIDALILFLQSALPADETAPQTPTITAPQPQASTRASRAASAYQSTAGAPPPRPPEPAQQTAPTDSYPSEQDIKTIHALLTDLNTLKTEGHTTLRIKEGENFLDSLILAIRRAKIV